MHLAPASRNTQQTLHCAAFCSQALLESSPAARGCRTQRSANNTAKAYLLTLRCSLLLRLPLGWGIAPTRTEKNWQRALCQFFLFSRKKSCAPETSVAERLQNRGSGSTSDCRTVSRHTVPVTSHPRVGGTHPGYRPHSPAPGQEERDSGAGSHGEPAPKGSFPPARSSGRGEKAVSATLCMQSLPARRKLQNRPGQRSCRGVVRELQPLVYYTGRQLPSAWMNRRLWITNMPNLRPSVQAQGPSSSVSERLGQP
jgi:hypothetical protein